MGGGFTAICIRAKLLDGSDGTVSFVSGGSPMAFVTPASDVALQRMSYQ
jgi:hypothetical protein